MLMLWVLCFSMTTEDLFYCAPPNSGLKPACSSANSSSALGVSQLSLIQDMILLAQLMTIVLRLLVVATPSALSLSPGISSG